MADALRKTGIPLMEEIPWGTHLALFYETEHRHEAAGSIELVPGRGFFFRHGVFDVQRLIENRRDRLRRARGRGFDGLRISGNAWDAASEHEQYRDFRRELADAVGDDPILALGTYEIEGSCAVDVLDVARFHHLTIARRRGDWQFIGTPELKRADAAIGQLNDALTIVSRPFPGHELLTEREFAVLAQIVKGASSKEIARELRVSPRTVDFHRANILQKLGARNTAEVIRAVLSPD